MGSIELPSLPKTKRWREVVALIGSVEGTAPAIAAATLDAADADFVARASDAGLVRTVWLLTQLPDAARSGDFKAALQELGIPSPDSPSLAEFTSSIAGSLDRFLAGTGNRTDIGEIAVGSAIEALANHLRPSTSSLFTSDVTQGVAKLATEAQFGRLAADFFARLAKRSLAYYVDRELPLHVGASRRFKTIAEQKAFVEALDLHCKQAAKIVERFAGCWWSKARHENGLTEKRTAGFVSYALTKLRGELRRGTAT